MGRTASGASICANLAENGGRSRTRRGTCELGAKRIPSEREIVLPVSAGTARSPRGKEPTGDADALHGVGPLGDEPPQSSCLRDRTQAEGSGDGNRGLGLGSSELRGVDPRGGGNTDQPGRDRGGRKGTF